MKKSITICTVVWSMVVAASVSYALPSDNFDDNSMDTSQWRLYEDSPTAVWLDETNERLELRSTGVRPPEWAEAYYFGKGWGFSPTADFSLKVDFAHGQIPPVISGDQDWDFSIDVNLAKDPNHHVSLEAGYGVYESDSSHSFFYCATVIDGVELAKGEKDKVADSGTLYISYDADKDELYLSDTGYWAANAWITLPGLLQGQWGGTVVFPYIGGWSDGVALGSGDAYLDNFVVDSGLVVPEDVEDIGEHVLKIEMSKTYDYRYDAGSTYRYSFDAAVQADAGIASIVMTTPGGSDYTLTLEVENGERWFNYHVSSFNEADLASFTAGIYTFMVGYGAGGSDTTTVLYALPGGAPIPPVTQRPMLLYPSDGSSGAPVPLTFQYEALQDAAWTAGLEWEATTGSDGGSVEGLPSSTNSYGPVNLDPNTAYQVWLNIGHVVWGTNPDGIPTVVDTDAEESFTFTTGPAVLPDIDMVMIMTEQEYVDGAVVSPNPWDFSLDVRMVESGPLDRIDVIKPGGTSPGITLLEEEPNVWTYEADAYPSLEALRAVYPEGVYTLEFQDSAGTLLKTVSIDYSGLSSPGSVPAFTYPSEQGQADVSTHPTFSWTIDPGAASFLALGVDDEATGDQVYGALPVPTTITSWSPGSLLPNHAYHLDVTVSRVKDWVGPALPTMAMEGDEFTYYLTFDYINTISFTTGASTLLHDWNGDGIVSIVGDVPPFVNCVYFGSCPSGVDTIAVGDCNGDGIVSIVGDVPCFVDCVYFQNCAK